MSFDLDDRHEFTPYCVFTCFRAVPYSIRSRLDDTNKKDSKRPSPSLEAASSVRGAYKDTSANGERVGGHTVE